MSRKDRRAADAERRKIEQHAPELSPAEIEKNVAEKVAQRPIGALGFSRRVFNAAGDLVNK
jgi:hypothetical protein